MNKNIIKERFLKINKKLGKSTGFWPGERSFEKTVKRVITLSIMISGYIPQMTRLVVYRSVNTILNDAPYVAATMGTICKTGNYMLNESKLKILLRGMVNDWSELKSEIEYDIMMKFGKKGYLIAILYLLHIAACTGTYSIMSLVPPILDIIIPLNQSRESIYLYPAYYSFDNAKYHPFIMVHMEIVVFCTCVLYCACDMNYVYAVQHACGLLAVTGHRFKHACSDLQQFDKKEGDQTECQVFRKVCESIRAHQRATEFVNEIQTCHAICLFIEMGVLMGSIAASLLMVTISESGVTWFIRALTLVTQLFHMFFLVVQGQFVVDAQDHLYDSIWEGTWYTTTKKTQALYMLSLRRCLTPPLLTAGGFVTLNLKTFTEVIKASVSYYTVMKS